LAIIHVIFWLGSYAPACPPNRHSGSHGFASSSASLGQWCLLCFSGIEGIAHTRCRPYHPMTQGKIERYHRSMKNILLLENYYSPDELTDQIDLFIEYHNNHRYHEALNNLIPVDVYYGNGREILTRREKIKKKTMIQRRRYNCSLKVASSNRKRYPGPETLSYFYT
jgi:transposase InsO family protein